MMDSDRVTPHQRLNRTKRRIKRDFEDNGCLVWVTKGRTIENYLTEQVLNDAIASVHTRTKRRIRWERFADLTHLRKDKIIDKVSVARRVAKDSPDYRTLDLDSRTNNVIARIKEHNG